MALVAVTLRAHSAKAISDQTIPLRASDRVPGWIAPATKGSRIVSNRPPLPAPAGFANQSEVGRKFGLTPTRLATLRRTGRLNGYHLPNDPLRQMLYRVSEVEAVLSTERDLRPVLIEPMAARSTARAGAR